ncbi:MAG: BamA/TamA family outer membrane protein [Salinivirgaceae bacterium]|nr:BamA/TamA family outer membrane protein [Salinivirgaceae bacterium]
MRQLLKELKSRSFIYFLVILYSLSSCKPTRLLTEDEYLFQNNTTKIDSKNINKSDLTGYYRQKPNKRTLIIFKLPLAAYNFSKLGKERKWKQWVGRVIGEPPTVYDSLLVERTRQQFVRYLKNEAYYNAIVTKETELKRKRAWVTYSIEAKDPIVINSVSYTINDSLIAPLIFSDTSKRMLRKGDLFKLESLQNERNRITRQVRDSGYFYFKEDYISYKVDTTDLIADINVVINKALVFDTENNPSVENHKKYWINKVFVYPDFDPQKAIRNKNNYFLSFDTIDYNGFNMIYTGDVNVRPKTILKANAICPGDKYNFSKVESTTKFLNSLRLFRLNNINFSPTVESDSLIDCNIQLTPATYQNISVNIETTSTQGNYGLGGYLNYQHRNLFKGAEILNIKVSGSVQRQNKTETNDGVIVDAFNIIDYGMIASLETPSFILPFKMQRFYKKYNPKTAFSLVLNTQKKPKYYNRNIYGISMGYNWKGSKNVKHVLNPFDFSSVTIPLKTQLFDSIIDGKYIENSFKDYFIAGGNYSIIFQNKKKTEGNSYTYVRWNVGIAGNLIHFLHRNVFTKDTVAGGYYKIFNYQYAQYVQSDIDVRYFGFFNKDHLIATRFFAGLAAPMPNGNAKAIPFVKQYFAGGAQDLRAWPARSLGPGTYTLPNTGEAGYYDQTADIKLAVNIEYRFSFTRSWKGALFVDAGNIWSISDEDERSGALFKRDEFYKQFAVGTGFGLRYDLKFAVLRLDWGIKVNDPSIQGNDSWVLFHNPFVPRNDLTWHFAIGYPF